MSEGNYSNNDKGVFRRELLEQSLDELLKGTDPESTWDYLLQRITAVFNRMCPIRSFCIKNY